MPYRMKSLAGPFMPGTIVTEQQVKDAGGDLDFWKSHGAVEQITETEAEKELDMSDGAVKARIETNIRNETVKLGRPLSKNEQDKIIADAKANKRPPVLGPPQHPAPPPASNPAKK